MRETAVSSGGQGAWGSGGHAASWPAAPPSGEPDRGRIGSYELLSVLGEGGFGVVYLAERREPIVQLVALKIVKPGMDSRAVIARFEQERQALAVMDHPNVARVFDAGTTDLSRPYFVMEYVPGPPITEYCDKRSLGVHERLELFVPVCEAVQHAHTKGIIHRDLKPSNVLVGERDGHPVPKVIDFGVAKALGRSLTDKTVHTEMGQMIGTPEYMSPEQAGMGGAAIDTRTDVYSLGVLLYELLTGILPFDPETLRTASLDQIRRMIREADPPRPSTAVAGLVEIAGKRSAGPEELSRQLRRELEWIPLKAMRKDPAERYQSPREMAEDIRNFLAGRALSAGPESATYRVRKFARRHRLALGAASAVLLSLILGFAGTTMAMLDARREAERATREAARATRRFNDVRALARSFIVDVEPMITELPGSTPARQVLVKTALEYLDTLRREAGDDPELLAEVAYAYECVGDVQGGLARANLGDASGALESFLHAQNLHLRRVTLLPGDLRTRHFLAVNHSRVGDAMMQVGRTADALEQYRAALGLFGTLSKARDGDRDMTREVAVNRSKAADALARLGRHTEALDAYRENLAVFEDLAADDDAGRRASRDLAICHSRIGDVLSDLGRPDEAIQEHRRSLAISEELATSEPDSTVTQRELAISHLSVGQILVARGRDAEAIEEYGLGLTIFEALAAADAANADAQMGLAYAHHEIADVLLSQKRAAEAVTEADAALAAVRPLAASDPGNADAGTWLARCLGLAAESRHHAAKDANLDTARRRELIDQAVAGYHDAQRAWTALVDRGAVPPARKSEIPDFAARITECEGLRTALGA